MIQLRYTPFIIECYPHALASNYWLDPLAMFNAPCPPPPPIHTRISLTFHLYFVVRGVEAASVLYSPQEYSECAILRGLLNLLNHLYHNNDNRWIIFWQVDCLRPLSSRNDIFNFLELKTGQKTSPALLNNPAYQMRTMDEDFKFQLNVCPTFAFCLRWYNHEDSMENIHFRSAQFEVDGWLNKTLDTFICISFASY